MVVNDVLVPMDGSPQSVEAARFAIGLADDTTAITLLHVIDSPAIFAGAMHAPLSTPDSVVASERAAITLTFSKLLAEHRDRPGLLRARIREGDPVREILEFTAEHAIDLLVLSARGRSGFARIVMGSIAEAIVRESPVPVLFVPDQSRLQAKHGATHVHDVLAGTVR